MLETNSKKALPRRRSAKRPLRLDPEGTKMWISGRHIFLRGLDETDIDSHYVNWLNDPEVNIFMATRRFPTTRESLKNFYEKIKSDDQALVLAICLKADGRHIGNVKLDKIDWISRACEFGLVIGEKKIWGQGYGSEATYLITQHGFFQLNLRRITIFLAAENTGALRCYAKAGYQTEGRLREAVFLNGKYRDVVVMGQVRRDFQVRAEYEPQ